MNRYGTGVYSYKERNLDTAYREDVLRKFGNLVQSSSGRTNLILDLACGDGMSADFLEEEFKLSTVRVDLSSDGLRLGRGKRVRAFADQLPFPDGSFSGVHMKDALVHMSSVKKLFEEVARVLGLKGKFVIISVDTPDQKYFNVEEKDGSLLQMPFSSDANYMEYAKKFDQDNIAIGPPYYPVNMSKTIEAAEKAGFNFIEGNKWTPQEQSDWYYQSDGWVERFVLFFEKTGS